jgi:uncharacterized membrane protein (DUF373 family)
MGAGPDTSSPEDNRWARLIQRFERVVVLVLIGLLMLVVAISTVELGWQLLLDLGSFKVMVLDMEEMFELFGFFLLVLIGLELLTTLKVHILKGVVHVEVVLEVALIAMAQKVIILDTYRSGPATMFGLAALIVALVVGYRLIRAAREPTRGA